MQYITNRLNHLKASFAALLGTLVLTATAHAQPSTDDLPSFSTDKILDALNEQVAPWAAKIVGALLALFVGWIIAGWIGRRIRNVVEKRNIDQTLGRFVANLVRYLVLIAVVLGVLGVFGIETSTFAAVIGAAGLAIGLAFEGTLSSFAAGAMLLIFRPFKVGDFVSAAGVTGFVQEIELFTTEIRTLDSQKKIVPNNKIFGDVITNIGAYDKRRVDIDVGADYGADLDATRACLEEAVKTIPGALSDPEPQIFLKSLGGSSVDWQVRVWCSTPDYWNVYEATIRATKMALDAKGIGIPFPQMDVHLDTSVVEALGKN
ncbi:MAG: mechanosensitive ion channel domain-containing protein [Myxococcota bacterium]